MEPRDDPDVDVDGVLSGTADWLTPDAAATLANHPLDCVETEYPHVAGSVDGPEQRVRPSEDHPVFFGCFDWHSAVHSHWSLVRQLRLADEHPDESEVVASVDRRFTPENVAAEVEYLDASPTFEKPYGWAWLLRLAAELQLFDDDRAREWRAVLEPLEARVVEGVRTEFLDEDRVFRVGTHGNTAFALAAVLDYARVVANADLEAATVERARECFADDVGAPIEYEPFGWDFLSPALTEADLLRRVLNPAAFEAWLDDFLPEVTSPPHDTDSSLLDPVTVADDSEDGLALHFVGLNLSRAWCLAGIASALDGHPCVDALERTARAHVEASLQQAFTEAYAGSHWLSTFVLYLGTRNAGGIAPER